MRDKWKQWWGVAQGHGWTIARDFQHRVARVLPERYRPPVAAPPKPWSTHVRDADLGAVRLTGWWHPGEPAAPAVLAVHGLGGDAESPYAARLAHACAQRGWGCLRVNLRGADLGGEDLYHAGLDADLAHVLGVAPLSEARDVFVVGFSLGGHTALRLGLQPASRLRAIAAVGSPLELDRSCAAIDRFVSLPYRTVVLASLKRAFAAVAARRPMHACLAEVQRLTTLRGWDETVIVPRFGFADVHDYWHRASVGPHLHALRCPALYIGSKFDPMVPDHTVEEALQRGGPSLAVHMLDVGGHVGFPGRVSLHRQIDGLEQHVLRWFDQHR